MRLTLSPSGIVVVPVAVAPTGRCPSAARTTEFGTTHCAVVAAVPASSTCGCERTVVLISATVRSQPQVLLAGTAATTAQWVVPNSVVLAALGHLPVGATATGTTTIPLGDNVNRIYADNRRT